MKKRVLFLLVVLSINLSKAQETNTVFLFPHTYPLNQLSSYGYSSITGNISNISALNPASINSFNKISGGFVYGTESRLMWLGNIGNERFNTELPLSAAMVVPFGNLKLSAGYNQLYNNSLDFGKIPKTTVEYPEGTGEFLTVEDKVSISTYSIGAAFSLKDIFKDSDQFIIGLRVKYNHMKNHDRMEDLYLDAEFGAYNADIGILYNVQNEKSIFSFGISYESSLDESKRAEMKGISSLVIVDPNHNGNNEYIVDIPRYWPVRFQVPAKLNTGVILKSANGMGFMGNLNLVFWNEEQNFNTEPQISGSFLYDISNIISSSIGFMYSSITLRDESFSIVNDSNLNAFYLTAGAAINLKDVSASLSFADSHIGSGKWRKQTIVKFGLGYNF